MVPEIEKISFDPTPSL